MVPIRTYFWLFKKTRRVCGVKYLRAYWGSCSCWSLYFGYIEDCSFRRCRWSQVTYRADSHSYFFCYNHTIHLCCHKTNISDRSVVNLHGITDDIQYYTNDYGYVPLVVNSFRSFPRSLLITGFVARLTRRVSLVRDSRGRDHMVVGFTTSHAISAYHH